MNIHEDSNSPDGKVFSIIQICSWGWRKSVYCSGHHTQFVYGLWGKSPICRGTTSGSGIDVGIMIASAYLPFPATHCILFMCDMKLNRGISSIPGQTPVTYVHIFPLIFLWFLYRPVECRFTFPSCWLLLWHSLPTHAFLTCAPVHHPYGKTSVGRKG